MFKKVLIVEDQEVANLGITQTLEGLSISHFEFVTYCDEALKRLKKAVAENDPYDLLIADLSFEKDHIRQELKNGQELIREAKRLQPELKVVVFSVEKRPKVIDDLYKIYGINGFVSKARNDGKELRNAIERVSKGETIISQNILNSIRNIPFALDAYDLKLLELLATGSKQNEIQAYLKDHQMQPHSIRSIEKRLNELRDSFGAKNNVEMIVICKDIGLI
ncbi:response regulator [uncultured Chryseobacterium sp.]|uniref:response regulator n=1 Tax=uncultured Chryseobacterium sp. TaxID=259322 RepID=UPI0025E8E731|nr:response regulator [uncultured Chryseobacterium sp.]